MGPPLTRQKSVEGKVAVETAPFLIKEARRNSLPGILLPLDQSTPPRLSTTHSLCLVTGIFLTLVGLICFTVLPHLEDLIRGIVLAYTALIPGGPMFSAWLTPPIVPHLSVYVFNITNPEEVLVGLDPITEELGPYVYSAQHIRTLVPESPSSPSSLSFRSRTLYKFQRELSAGGEEDPLTVLNMVMLTGFNKVKHQMSVVKAMARPVLTSVGRGKPVLKVTVGGFLFGYEDELACITDPLGPILGVGDDDDDDDDDDSWGDDWDDEEGWRRRRRKREIPSYRDASGACLWGILRDLNNTEHETVRINTGTTNYRRKGGILGVDDREVFGAWEKGSTCDRLTDSIEPSTLPASLPQSFSLMVPVMCRKLQMQARYSHSIEGVDVTRYTVDKDSMKQDKCYCPQPEVTPCLPDGYLHLEPCYPDISPPMAVSFPHGLYSPAPRMLTHTPKPDPSKHEIYMDVNRELGVPMGVHVSFQLSALLQPDPAFPLLENVNRTKLVPLFWATEGFSTPTPWMVSTTNLALSLPSLGAQGISIGLLLLGGVLTLITLAMGALARRRSKSREGLKS